MKTWHLNNRNRATILIPPYAGRNSETRVSPLIQGDVIVFFVFSRFNTPVAFLSGSFLPMPKPDPPEVVELFDVIESLVGNAVSFNGTIVRSVGTKYANEDDFLTGFGASKYGGRWNRPGVVAIYGSMDILTATMEAYQQFLAFGFSLSSIQPRVTAGARVVLHKVFDLTSSAIRRKIGFSRDELVKEDWHAIQATGDESWTQAIGRGSLNAGFEGLLAPSAQNPKGANLVIFPKNLLPHSSLKILGKSALPPHPSTWPAN